MKQGIHPDNYREVAFKDMSNEEVFITRSTVNTKETIEIDGKTYPLVKLEITSSSHPFFTGKPGKYTSFNCREIGHQKAAAILWNKGGTDELG